MGLVLELKPNESIYVGDTKITIAVDKNQHKNRERKPVKLYFDGPRDTLILRGKLVEREDSKPKTTQRHYGREV